MKSLILPLLCLSFLLPGALRADIPAVPGLTFAVGPSGLTSLHYETQEFITEAWNGAPRVNTLSPVFRRANGTAYDFHQVPANAPALSSKLDAAKQKVTFTYAWGAVSYTYHSQGDTLLMTIGVHNTTADTLMQLGILMMQMNFPIIPTATSYDSYWAGTNGPHPLPAFPLVGNPRYAPAVLSVDYGTGVLDFCNESAPDAATVTIPFTTNPPTQTMYPLFITLSTPVAPGAGQTTTFSLRFAPAGVDGAALAQDLFARYRAAHPFRLRWNDRRPIAMEMVAASGVHPASGKNPRGWFNNDASVDVTTPGSEAEFRKRVMAYADSSIKVLKDVNAQGMITWDTEGEEYGGATYYGDPRLVGKLAPEMEYKDASGIATIDAYFQKFRKAGFRVGVCLRPTQIAFVNSVPQQQDSPDFVKTLKDKIAYCKKRWGCTLFYVDSNTDANGPLNPDSMEAIAKAYPDVLLIPEIQNTRYYAFSAPLDDSRMGVTQTPHVVQDVYSGAFTVLMSVGDGPEGMSAANRIKLLAGVRHGDIAMFAGWFPNDTATFVKGIYKEAGPWKPVRAVAEKRKL